MFFSICEAVVCAHCAEISTTRYLQVEIVNFCVVWFIKTNYYTVYKRIGYLKFIPSIKNIYFLTLYLNIICIGLISKFFRIFVFYFYWKIRKNCLWSTLYNTHIHLKKFYIFRKEIQHFTHLCKHIQVLNIYHRIPRFFERREHLLTLLNRLTLRLWMVASLD